MKPAVRAELEALGGAAGAGPSPCGDGCRRIRVDSTSPLELRAQFPGASLQFIKDGDRIGVFLGTDDAD
ncbi:hypothetical protein [Microbacterium aurantiacum]|uniref:Uncharacterized protein n=1 Tax=Microbacterium aurantiacum TaxID=162393 RepID=A0A0M8MKK0_9MICO|nr:hypothetical protein [Microbacterium chocolatum]ANG84906.1 hypothetical protein A8L33_05485 [Microbacterium chocolatum]KOS12007.1 hypothetical protein XI38_00800 [Microbacterium chocolatum]